MSHCISSVLSLTAVPVKWAKELLGESIGKEGLHSVLLSSTARLLLLAQTVISVVSLPFAALANLALSWYAAVAEDKFASNTPIADLSEEVGQIFTLHAFMAVGGIFAAFLPGESLKDALN